MGLSSIATEALRFLHESGGWLDSDPHECRIHKSVLKSFERKGWVTCDRDESGITACSTTLAGHEAARGLEGHQAGSCHGCSFHYARMKSVAGPPTTP